MDDKDKIIDSLKTSNYYLRANASCYKQIITDKNRQISFLKKELKKANEKLELYKEVNFKQYCIEDY